MFTPEPNMAPGTYPVTIDITDTPARMPTYTSVTFNIVMEDTALGPPEIDPIGNRVVEQGGRGDLHGAGDRPRRPGSAALVQPRSRGAGRGDDRSQDGGFLLAAVRCRTGRLSRDDPGNGGRDALGVLDGDGEHPGRRGVDAEPGRSRDRLRLRRRLADVLPGASF